MKLVACDKQDVKASGTFSLRGLRYILAIQTLFTAEVAVSQLDQLELAEPQKGFNEYYTGHAKASSGGDLLVGLVYEAHTERLDVEDVRLDYRGDAGMSVCVRLTTSDGRYWAVNTYRSRAEYSRPPVVPITTRYEEQLRTYDQDDFLILAFRGDCDSDNVQSLIAARVDNRDRDDNLLAYVNINRGYVSARLEQDGRPVPETKTECISPPQGAHVAYSLVCHLPLKELSKAAPGAWSL